MQYKVLQFKNLIELLLGPIRERPGMYLGQDKLSALVNFITGYGIGFDVGTDETSNYDPYFGNDKEDGFLEWFRKKYKPKDASYWTNYFLVEANNDDRMALQVFFKYLEEFSKEKMDNNRD